MNRESTFKFEHGPVFGNDEREAILPLPRGSGVSLAIPADQLIAGTITAALNVRPEVRFMNPDTGAEMVRIAADGFYVRGVKLDQDGHEARAVYEAFCDLMNIRR